MKIISKYSLLALTMLAGLFFNSCTDDEQMAHQPEKATMVGTWFYDASSDGTQILSTNQYKADGTTDIWIGLVDLTNSIFLNYQGTFTATDNSFTENYNSPITGNPTTESFNITQLDKYTLTFTSAANNTSSTYNRLIDSYEMTVGQTQVFDVKDNQFNATSYTSTNTHVATVNASGNIQAVRRGFAFIKAVSVSGTAVIRVDVTDAAQPVDDMMPFLGASVDDVKAAYGDNYLEVPGSTLTEWRYNLMDDVIESITFTTFMQQAIAATVKLRENVDVDAITAMLDARYTKTLEMSIGNHYQTEKDGQKYLISWNWRDGTITYLPDNTDPDPDPQNYPSSAFEQFDGLIQLNINEAAAALNYTLTDENMEDGFTDDINITGNEVFESLSLLFDEDEDSDEYLEVGTVMLYCNRNVKQEDIEGWYKAHYEETGDELNPYHSKEAGKKEFWVSFKQVGSRLQVLYKTSKRRR